MFPFIKCKECNKLCGVRFWTNPPYQINISKSLIRKLIIGYKINFCSKQHLINWATRQTLEEDINALHS